MNKKHYLIWSNINFSLKCEFQAPHLVALNCARGCMKFSLVVHPLVLN